MTRSRDVADTQDNLGGAVAPFVAGKNFVINGAFNVWQRGTNFGTSSGQYTADRWFTNAETTSTARSTDAPTGLAYSLQLTANTGFPLFQFIELPATGNGGIFTAGSTFTLSFYAKASTATTMQGRMQFADDKSGTNSATIFALQNVANVTTSWERYTFTFTVANNANATNILAELLLYKGSVSSGTTMKIAGVQLEAGNVATPFQTASGSIGGELALCQRYFWRASAAAGDNILSQMNTAYNTSGVVAIWKSPVTMRTKPSSIDYANLQLMDWVTATTITSATADANATPEFAVSVIGVSGTPLTQFRPYAIRGTSSSGYVGFSAEL